MWLDSHAQECGERGNLDEAEAGSTFPAHGHPRIVLLKELLLGSQASAVALCSLPTFAQPLAHLSPLP